MVVSILLITFLLYLITGKRWCDSQKSLLLRIYVLSWGGVLLLSCFGFYDMSIPKNSTFLILLLHLFGFVLGAAAISGRTSAKKEDIAVKVIEAEINSILKSSVFRALLIFMVIYSVFLFSKYLTTLLFYNSMSETRTDLISIYGKFYFDLARPMLFLPMSIICYVLFGYSLLKKRDWVCILMGGFLLLNASFNGGRIGYVYILLGIVFVNIYIVKANVIKHLPAFLSVLAVVYVLIVLVSSFRHGTVDISWNNIQEGIEVTNRQTVTYLTGSQAAFDYAISNNYLNISKGYGYGIFTFLPLVNFINLFTNTLMGVDIASSAMGLVSYIEENQIVLGGDTRWNALYTSVLFYYLDGGVIGAFFYPFIMGLLWGWLIKKMMKSGSAFIFSLTCFIFMCMIKSIMKMEVFYAYDVFAMLVLYIIGTRKKTIKWN